jgi:hypothetical protein
MLSLSQVIVSSHRTLYSLPVTEDLKEFEAQFIILQHLQRLSLHGFIKSSLSLIVDSCISGSGDK